MPSAVMLIGQLEHQTSAHADAKIHTLEPFLHVRAPAPFNPLVSQHTQHGAARTTGAGRPRAGWPGIRNLLLLIGGRSSTDGGTRAAGGGGRGRSARIGARGRTGGNGRGGTRGRLSTHYASVTEAQVVPFRA